jgi:hypothetical protein
MLRFSRLNAVVFQLTSLVAVFTLVCSRADAQVKPFKVSGGGVADYIPVTPGDPVFHWAVGQATGLGRYYGEGRVQLDQFTSPTTAEFSSAEPFVFTAANGDKLAFTYGKTDNGAAQPGQVELFYVGDGLFVTVWVAEFNPVPELCTGRFSKVIAGSFIMVAVTEPFVLGATDPVAYSWEGEGWIEFQKGARW